jgi:hypothetical protein
MIPTRSLHEVLQEAVAYGWLPVGIEDRAREALAAADADDMPWYLRVLTGGAAWVGAFFLLATGLGIISVILGEQVDLAAIGLGVGLMPLGIAMRTTRRGEFMHQASLVCVMAGQMLLVGGTGSLMSSTDLAVWAAILSSLVLILRFDDGVYRFCATLVVIGGALFLAMEVRIPYAMGIATAITAAWPVVAWRMLPGLARRHRVADPVAWAAATASCGLLTTQAIIDAVTGTVGYSPSFVRMLLPSPLPLTLLFVGLLVWLALRVARDHGVSSSAPGVLAAVGAAVVVGVLTRATPAVSGALVLVMLGFDRRRVGLVGLGSAFLIGFLGLHYYSLALTLMQKSAVLVGSGLVCLAGAAFFRQGLPEEAP